MTWRRAWGYVALFLALWFLHTVSDRPATRDEVGEPASAGGLAPVPFLAAQPGDINEVEVEDADRLARLRRSGEGWQVVQPEGASVPGDLISALLTAVLDVPEIEVVGSTDDPDADFGLTEPSAELRLRPSGQPALVIRLGSLNPAKTGVYASGSGTNEVVLLGLNIRYYLDLVLEALFRKR